MYKRQDLYYTLEGDMGMYTLYSKDEWNAEKKDGPVLLDTIGGIEQAHLKSFNYPRLVLTSDTAGDLHFVEIINGSFNTIDVYKRQDLMFRFSMNIRRPSALSLIHI